MKIRFKVQDYQTDAVNAVVDCFAGQPRNATPKYTIDACVTQESATAGFRNADLRLAPQQLLANIQQTQLQQNIPLSTGLISSPSCDVNLDVEMETGTGKTYCYIKTMFELYDKYGWNKFIVVVPSIAIREGVQKSFEITADHFLEQYGLRARYFTYDSRQLHQLESFSSDTGINVMIVNVQAFNAFKSDARNKTARIMFSPRDDFQSRRPIDVLKKNRPIMILDEPQRMGGKQTSKALAEFDPLMLIRYSATHKVDHNKVYRLDALDAYNQKLVKKIAVRGIEAQGLTGTDRYLYLEGIRLSPDKPPIAVLELERKMPNGGVRRIRKLVSKGDNLYTASGQLEQYQGYIVADIDYRGIEGDAQGFIEFTNGERLTVGTATGDTNEDTLRRLQIRESIKAHLDKEQQLNAQGIKCLTLFFIDTVKKYRDYDRDDTLGDYARLFEQEYASVVQELRESLPDDSPYRKYVETIAPSQTHAGYFSIDKQGRLTDPKVTARGETKGEADDVDAYDLILKDKESLLSLPSSSDDEQTRQRKNVRFLFSHSALREGWDNPNVFTIGMLKPIDYEGTTVTRRQEVGRGLRLCVDSDGQRIDDPAIVHGINVLTVVANESFQDFVNNLQAETREALSARCQTDPHFDDTKLPNIENGRLATENKPTQPPPQPHSSKPIKFDTNQLIANCINALNRDLQVSHLSYTVHQGTQSDFTTINDLDNRTAYESHGSQTNTVTTNTSTEVRYDLLGHLANSTKLTRKTIAKILSQIDEPTFHQYQQNPEEFLTKTTRIINQQSSISLREITSPLPSPK